MCCHHTHTACTFSNKAFHCLKSSMSGCFSILKSIELCNHEGQINSLKALWGEGKLSEEQGCTSYEEVCNFQSITLSLVNTLIPSCIFPLCLVSLDSWKGLWEKDTRMESWQNEMHPWSLSHQILTELILVLHTSLKHSIIQKIGGQ